MVLCGPANQAQMDEALLALERGPLDAEEHARLCRIGDHVYGHHRPQFGDRGDQQSSASA